MFRRLQSFFLRGYEQFPLSIQYKTKFLVLLDMVLLIIAPIAVLIHLLTTSHVFLIAGDIFAWAFIFLSLILIKRKKYVGGGNMLVIGAIIVVVIHNLIGDYFATEPQNYLRLVETTANFIVILLIIPIFATNKYSSFYFSLVETFFLVGHFFILKNRFYNNHAETYMFLNLVAYSIILLISGYVSSLLISKTQEIINLAESKAEQTNEYNRQLEERVFERTRELMGAYEELENLNEITRQISVSLDFDSVFHRVAEMLTVIYKFDGCAFFRLEHKDNTAHIEKMYPPEQFPDFWDNYVGRIIPLKKNSLLWRLIQHYDTLLIHKDESDQFIDPLLSDRTFLERYLIRTILILPAVVNNEVIGILYLTTHNDKNELSEQDLASVNRFVNQIALVIKNSRLYNETLETRNLLQDRNAKIENELNIARRIQMRLIPKESPTPKLAFLYQPMDKVGGDFFDFILFPSGKMGILVTDVAGHGVPAALMTSMIKGFTVQFASSIEDPAEFLFQLNESLCNLTEDLFVTAFYCIFNPQNRELIYSNAGHNPPFLLLENTIETIPKFQPGIPLGFLSNKEIKIRDKSFSYQNSTVTLPAKSRLFLYTDGLTEVVNICDLETRECEKIDDFGDICLQEVLLQSRRKKSNEMLSAVMKRLIEFRGIETFDDDVCMISMDVD